MELGRIPRNQRETEECIQKLTKECEGGRLGGRRVMMRRSEINQMDYKFEVVEGEGIARSQR